jgi:hypothetical protein
MRVMIFKMDNASSLSSTMPVLLILGAVPGIGRIRSA